MTIFCAISKICIYEDICNIKEPCYNCLHNDKNINISNTNMFKKK